jgi:hypothetical protein
MYPSRTGSHDGYACLITYIRKQGPLFKPTADCSIGEPDQTRLGDHPEGIANEES